MSSETKTTGRASDKFMLRLPDGMRERIASAAKADGRTMNAEIVARIQETFIGDEKLRELLARIEEEGGTEEQRARIDTLTLTASMVIQWFLEALAEVPEGSPLHAKHAPTLGRLRELDTSLQQDGAEILLRLLPRSDLSTYPSPARPMAFTEHEDQKILPRKR